MLHWVLRGVQGIHVTAYSPLGSPDSATMMKRSEDAPRLLQEPTVLDISKKHDRPAGQVCDACLHLVSRPVRRSVPLPDHSLMHMLSRGVS